MLTSIKKKLKSNQSSSNSVDTTGNSISLSLYELRYAALTLTLINIEKGLHPKKRIWQGIENRTYSLYVDLMLCHWAVVAHQQIVPKRVRKQLSHVASFAFNEKRNRYLQCPQHFGVLTFSYW